MLNPYGNREKIEGRVLYVFFKLVYDPYWDGMQESMIDLIEEATRLANDIKQLQREQEQSSIARDGTSPSSDRLVEVREEIEGMWPVDDIVREMFSLSDRFIHYKHGLVQLPSTKQRQFLTKSAKECTFRPRINKISKEIEKRNWQFRMQNEKQELML